MRECVRLHGGTRDRFFIIRRNACRLTRVERIFYSVPLGGTGFLSQPIMNRFRQYSECIMPYRISDNIMPRNWLAGLMLLALCVPYQMLFTQLPEYAAYSCAWQHNHNGKTNENGGRDNDTHHACSVCGQYAVVNAHAGGSIDNPEDR